MMRKFFAVLLTTLFAITICSNTFADNSTMFYNTGSSSARSAASNTQSGVDSSTWTGTDYAEKMPSKYKYIEYGAVGVGVLAAGGLITYAILDHHGNSNDDNTPSNPNSMPLTPITPTNCILPSPGNIETTNITQTSAAVSWTAATSSCDHAIKYTAKAIRVSDSAVIATVTTNGLTAGLTGLTVNTQYKVEITAQDKSGNTATASANFTTVPAICTPKVYVTDSNNHRIQVFDTSGNFLTKWGTKGTKDGQFNSLVGIASDSSGNVYAIDTYNQHLQKFESSGAFIAKWDLSNAGGWSFNTPLAIAVDSSGNMYVTDLLVNQVQKFDSNGNYITQWETGTTPFGVAVDNSGNIYVANFKSNSIQKFASNGTLITQWGFEGSNEGQFKSPTGIAVDSSGNVYVADTGNNRIQKFNSDGKYISQWGSLGSGNGQFDGPTGIAVNSSGNVYVADTGNNRIQKFDSDGKYISQWGSKGSGNGQFEGPGLLAYSGCP